MALSGANVVGYTKCSKEAQARLEGLSSGGAASMLGGMMSSGLASNMLGGLMGRARTAAAPATPRCEDGFAAVQVLGTKAPRPASMASTRTVQSRRPTARSGRLAAALVVVVDAALLRVPSRPSPRAAAAARRPRRRRPAAGAGAGASAGGTSKRDARAAGAGAGAGASASAMARSRRANASSLSAPPCQSA